MFSYNWTGRDAHGHHFDSLDPPPAPAPGAGNADSNDASKSVPKSEMVQNLFDSDSEAVPIEI